MRAATIGLTAALLAGPAALGAQVSGFVELEARLFPVSPLDPAQGRHGASVAAQPELYHAWDRGRQILRFEPFARLDAGDGRRTHVDIRELTWERAWDMLELRVGIGKVYWGVTESQHLVDIVNQTDLVEDLDGEQKLGQPMVRLALVRPWGTLTGFVLPGFRERTFPGADGRLRFPLVVSDDAVYESGAGRRHVDWALRWSHYLGSWDIGVSHFAGTSREPRLVADGGTRLVPYYDLIHQTGLDVQFTSGGWLWKLEAMRRSGQGETFAAFTGGFEYTLVGVMGGPADLGILVEYLYDDRGADAPTPFDDDVFVGARLTPNDVQSTNFLAGVIVDRTTRSSFINVEASRRWRDRWRLVVEARAFVGADAGDRLHGLRRDDYLQLGLERHF